MLGGEVTIFVLNEMQVLDQQVAAARAIAQQRANLLKCGVIDLAALGLGASTATTTTSGLPQKTTRVWLLGMMAAPR